MSGEGPWVSATDESSRQREEGGVGLSTRDAPEESVGDDGRVRRGER